MDQLVAIKWMGIISFLLLMCKISNYFPGDTKQAMLQGATVDGGMMAANLHTSTGDLESFSNNQARRLNVNVQSYLAFKSQKRTPPSHLDPRGYRYRNRCNFSEFVRKFKPEEMEINCANIHIVRMHKLLGTGKLREVYEGTFHGRKVAVKKAVKKVRQDQADKVKRSITQEAALSFQLRGASHIVQMIGWCDTTIVMEKANGTLEDLIRNKEQEISVESALKMALDVAKGLHQLHSIPMGPVSHNDITASQFLFMDDGTLALNDFDSIRYVGHSNLGTKCTPDKVGDFFKDEKYDVYRTAIVLWMLRGRAAPTNFYTNIKVRPIVEEMSDYPQGMQDLIVQAWDSDPYKRPGATEMMQRIEAILRDYLSAPFSKSS